MSPESRFTPSDPIDPDWRYEKDIWSLLSKGDALFEYADFYDYRPSYPDYDPDKASDTDMEVECGSKASQGEPSVT